MDVKDSQQLPNAIIKQLPPQRKIIYQLSHVNGLSYEEIAQQLAISKNTVKNKSVKALKFIKKHCYDV